jgi:hypothetical protein
MMNDFTNNNSFEEQWQKAFDDASLPPSDSVWEKIEQGLNIEEVPLPQPPKNIFPGYYLGSVLVVLLGIGSWIFIENTQFQGEKPVEEKEINVVKIPENIASTLITAQKNENVKRPLNLPMKAKWTVPLKEDVLEEQPILAQEEEPERTKLADSIGILSPLPAKNLTGTFQTPNVEELQTETTPYYEPTKPKPKKKSILRNIKISVGVGTYQH